MTEEKLRLRTNQDFEKLENRLDTLIVDHRIADAQELLGQLSPLKIPDFFRTRFAPIFRRAGLDREALQVLFPIIHERKDPKAEDVIEYASTLRKLGMPAQALLLLDRLPKSSSAEVQRGFCFMHQWDYRSSVAALEEVVADNQKENLIAELNLAAGLVQEADLERAEFLLKGLEDRCKMQSKHLWLNWMEVTGQCRLAEGNFEGALSILSRAAQVAEGEPGATTFFVRKWKLLVEVASGLIRQESDEIGRFRKDARHQGHWESLRDFDWQLAFLTQDSARARNVLFGTPYSAFQEKMLRAFPELNQEKRIIRIDPRWQGERSEPILAREGRGIPISFGLPSHRLLLALMSDVYRPWTVQRLFDFLHCHEVFDPMTSANRMHQLISRLRRDISTLPLELTSSESGFRLRVKDEGRVVVGLKMCFTSAASLTAAVLADTFGSETFSVQNFKETFFTTEAQTSRLLSALVKEGVAEALASGRGRRYRLLSNKF